MTAERHNVLVSSAGRRVKLVRFFQSALRELRLDGRCLVSDMHPEWSAAARVADGAFVMPAVADPHYAEALFSLVESQGIRLIVPTIDTELRVLAELRPALAERGCDVVVSDGALVEICRDKRQSAEWFRQLGCESPRELDRSRLEYPCFAKPCDGSLSRGTRALKHAAMLSEDLLQDPKTMFLEYFAPEEWVEYTIDAYYDRGSTLRCLVPRRRVEVRGGEISKGQTEYGAMHDHLWPLLRTVPGARGCLTYQFFAAKSIPRWVAIELNPRFGGGFPLSYAAGARYPEWLLREYLLSSSIADYRDWTSGLAMVRFDDEILFSLPPQHVD